jgi:formate-dependent nitrite reductase membrane component NrfD
MSWAFLTSQLKNPYYWSVDTTHTFEAVQMVTSELPLYGPDWTYWLAPIIAFVFLGITGVLLIADLDRPERFWTILVRPQWRSWLAIGSYIILVYSILLVALIAMYAMQMSSHEIFKWVYDATVLPAVMTSIYTAFLFAQAKGRDLWQSPVFPIHLLVQSIMAGSATIIIAGTILRDTSNVQTVSATVLAASTLAHLVLISTEILVEHSSKAKARAVHMMTRGPYSQLFWGMGICVGSILPLSLLAVSAILHWFWLFPIAAAISLIGLLAYEHCFVMAGQSVRLS